METVETSRRKYQTDIKYKPPLNLALSLRMSALIIHSNTSIQGGFFAGPPPKSTEKLIKARLGLTNRTIYINVDSPNLDFPYFNFLG